MARWNCRFTRLFILRFTDSCTVASTGFEFITHRALQLENSLNRFIAGLHPQLSTVQRDKLFYSDNWLDSPQERLRQRLAIACNPSISIEYLQRFAGL
jgi:hypothetical protein